MSPGHPLRVALDAALADADARDWPPLGDAARRSLLDYLDLLARWNRAYNLTAVRDPAQMLVRHVLDSLAVAPLVRGPRLLDVGTGAGLPGLVLAIARPELSCTLLDSSLKKTRFCAQAVLDLSLANVQVCRQRLEDLATGCAFDTVVSRAVGDVAWLWRHSQRLTTPAGRLLVMKGQRPAAELEEVTAMGENPRAVALQVPGLDEQRHAVVVERRATAPSAG